jgi:hypothetical protein
MEAADTRNDKGREATGRAPEDTNQSTTGD